VLVLGRVAARAEGRDRHAEALQLVAGEAVAPRLVGRREVRHQPADAQVFEVTQTPGELGGLVVPHAEPAQPRVHLDVYLGHDSGGARRRVERLGHVEPVDDRDNRLREARLGLPLPEAAEAEDGAAHARAAQREALLGRRHAEPVRAFGFEPARAIRRAVAVGVSLDHAHHLDAHADERAHRAEVPGERVQVNLGPGRATARQHGIVHEIPAAGLRVYGKTMSRSLAQKRGRRKVTCPVYKLKTLTQPPKLSPTCTLPHFLAAPACNCD
jgi:hypothetical protein